MRSWSAVLTGLTMQVIAPEQPPAILQIYREPLKPEQEAAWAAIEEEKTRLCLELKCPHPYLGIESLSGRKEVWFFNGYDSTTDRERVYEAYAGNTKLMTALLDAAKRQGALTEAPIEVFTSYRQDVTRGVPWLLGRGRFLVISITETDARIWGTVFEAQNGMRFIFRSASGREEADAIATQAGSDARVFAVRPAWSMPAQAWIDSDPIYWRSYPPR